MIHDLESATGLYTRASTGGAVNVNIPRYQYRIFADTACSFVFVDVILTAVRHCLQSVYVLTSGVMLHGVVDHRLKVTSHFWSRLLYGLVKAYDWSRFVYNFQPSISLTVLPLPD